MQKTAATKKNNQNSFNVFPNEKTRLVYEKQIGIHYSSCSDFRKVGNKKINSKTHQKQLLEEILVDKNSLQKKYDMSLTEKDDVENILEIFRMSEAVSK